MKRTIKFILISAIIVILVLSTFAFIACKIPDNPPDVDPNPDENIKTVSFNINGGDGKIESMQFEVGKTIANLPLPERSGYEFVCWTDEIGTEYAATTVMSNTNLLLTAKWKLTIPFIFSLNSDGNSFSIVGIDSTFDGTNIVIPNMYEGKLITEICDGAFRNCSSVTSITIPDSVTTIGADVFKDCGGLESITIGNNVANVGRFAFNKDLLPSTAPPRLFSIANLFKDCPNIKEIEFNGTMEQWKDMLKGVSITHCAPVKRIVCFDGEILL